MSGCCSGFTRSEALRAAAAGGRVQSVREWDARMPLPAGTGMDRRRFLLGAAGGLLSVYGAGRLGLGPSALRDGIAQASGGGAQPVLVSVFLAGGVDALSVLAPVDDPVYRQARPTLAVGGRSGTPFGEDPRLRWADIAAPLSGLHDAGKLSVLPAIGYAAPDLSHFTSRHYWEVGELNPFGRIGWLGRYLDKHGAADNPLQGLSLDWSLAPALAASNVPVAAVSNPEYFSLDSRDVWDGGIRTKLIDALAAQGKVATTDPELKAARTAATQTVGLRGQLAGLQGTDAPWQTAVGYPSTDGFARRLAVLAEMLDMGLPLRVVALDANGGYDTHDNQNGTLPDDIALFSRSLAAFQADLEARGLADRVLINVWSEFGRRPEENGSGTDHGAAGLSLLIGTRAKGTMIGEFPGLGTLDEDDNLRHTTDFRAVYCSLLEQWMGVDAAAVIPNAGGFGRLKVVA
jgi:uncharacterized protein (DUF1501 family)